MPQCMSPEMAPERKSSSRVCRDAMQPGLRFASTSRLVAIGKAIGLQEEAEQDSAVRRHGLVLIASRSPDELTRSALSLVILERAFDDISLLERSVLVQRHEGARIELEQRRGDTGVVGIQYLNRDPGNLVFSHGILGTSR